MHIHDIVVSWVHVVYWAVLGGIFLGNLLDSFLGSCTALVTATTYHGPQSKLNVVQSLQRFLNKYGFCCVNEQKLEENSLHDDPGRLSHDI